MKNVLTARLATIMAIATGVSLIGSIPPVLADGIPLESHLLTTEPASVNQVRSVSYQNQSVYSPAQLDAVAGSISGRPQKRKEPSIIPDGLIPAGIVKSPAEKPVDPIDFFKVPGPDPGLKVPINQY